MSIGLLRIGETALLHPPPGTAEGKAAAPTLTEIEANIVLLRQYLFLFEIKKYKCMELPNSYEEANYYS